MQNTEISALEESLNYSFSDKGTLVQAVCHSSYVNEQARDGLEDNERLEFVGDAVLNLVIGHMLMDFYPDLDEGALSRMRANLVNESCLAEVARRLDIGSYIRLGKGEIQSHGKDKSSILANTVEALIAAVYMDGGFEAAFALIQTHFSGLIPTGCAPDLHQDYKSRLQEYVQAAKMEPPCYRVVREIGPDHAKTFVVRLCIFDHDCEGVGKSKKAAEQDAACKVLERLESDA